MRESGFTVAMYFANILSLVLTMLLYYGLMIILGIAMLIAIYDYNYNYDDYVVYHSNRLQQRIDEIRSTGDVKHELDAFNKLHEGHDHWIMPFDFQNIHKSVWFALLPVTIILWKNLQILKMDNMAEFVYFKSGLRTISAMKVVSIFLFIGYSLIVITNLNQLETNLNWKNFEGIVVYSLMALTSISLHEYCKSKLRDFETAIEEHMKRIKK